MGRFWRGINDEGISGTVITETGTFATAQSDLTAICTVDVRDGASILWAEVYNSDVTLQGFEIQVKPHGSGSFSSDFALEDSDYTTDMPEPIKHCSADLTTLSSDTSAYLKMEVKALDQVKFYGAASSSDTSNIKVYWSVR